MGRKMTKQDFTDKQNKTNRDLQPIINPIFCFAVTMMTSDHPADEKWKARKNPPPISDKYTANIQNLQQRIDFCCGFFFAVRMMMSSHAGGGSSRSRGRSEGLAVRDTELTSARGLLTQGMAQGGVTSW
jgi:hypothetical protein